MRDLPELKSLPVTKKHKKYLRSVLSNHPNALRLCIEKRFDQAAALLLEDGRYFASHCLQQLSQPVK